MTSVGGNTGKQTVGDKEMAKPVIEKHLFQFACVLKSKNKTYKSYKLIWWKEVCLQSKLGVWFQFTQQSMKKKKKDYLSDCWP